MSPETGERPIAAVENGAQGQNRTADTGIFSQRLDAYNTSNEKEKDGLALRLCGICVSRPRPARIAL